MKKVIRDNRGYPLGWTDTTLKKGVYTEFCDKAGYTYRGYIAETVKSLDLDEKHRVEEKGELF
ncbi:MAG: hypothetical protein JRI72_16360 [Deltaproteobacteria bacterium]|nr:hypothetical protein [Deltaproteobacteria bacterium]